MITWGCFKATGGAMIAAVSMSGLLALSACEERPYPTATKSSYAEAPKAPPAELAGAPAQPPSYQSPAYEPPRAEPAYAPPAPAYAPPSRAYDPPAIVAMAPIPNPGEDGAPGYRHRAHGRYLPAPVQGPDYRPAPVRPAPTYAARPYTARPAAPAKTYAPKAYAAKPAPAPAYKPDAPVKPAYAAAPKPAAPKPPVYAAAKPVAPIAPPKSVKAETKAVAAAAQTTVDKAKAAAPTVAKAVDDKAKAAAAAAAAAAVIAADKAKTAAHDAKSAAVATADKAKVAYDANKAAAAPAANAADRATRLAALQSALTDAISKGAVLKAPDRFTANQPADVTLTIPAAFADTLRTEAGKNGLTDAAASVNMTAVLSGDGFSVTPDETLSLPLTAGQPTEFKWTVTALPGAKGPLHADIGADLLGGGSDTLALGSVQKSAGFGIKPSARLYAAIILVLIAALIVVWLARGRGPTRSASARRASRAARGRPLDMAEGSEAAH